MTRRTWTDVQLIDAVSSSITYRDVIGKLGLSTNSAGNWKSIQIHIDRLGLTTEHFDRYALSRSGKLNPPAPLSEVLIQGSSYGTSSLAKRLVREGILPYKCDDCEISEWRGSPLSLELDHINGINNDHRIENLRLLCPNCHSLTPTWRGRGNRKEYFCECGKQIFKGSSQCNGCARRFPWPSDKELLLMCQNFSFAKVGRVLGVSGQAVGRRVRKAGSKVL